MTATCPACRNPYPDGILCGRCHGRLEQDLAQVPALDTQLLLVLGNQTSYAARHGGRSAEAPLVINPGVVEPRGELKAVLVSWTRLVLEERYGSVTGEPAHERCLHAECRTRRQARGPADDTAEIGRWLFTEAVWLRSHPAAGELADEVGLVCRRLWRLVDVPWDRVRFLFGEACIVPDCSGLLWAWPKAERPVVRCAGCGLDCCAGGGHEWVAEQWYVLGQRILARRESKVVVA